MTLEEVADRTALAYRATTHAELVPLTSDLPTTAASAAPPQALSVRIRGVSFCGPVFIQSRRS